MLYCVTNKLPLDQEQQVEEGCLPMITVSDEGDFGTLISSYATLFGVSEQLKVR